MTELYLYHGTSIDAAMSIVSSGFRASSHGELGAGVYLAHLDKASNFARDADARHKGSGVAVLRCTVTVNSMLRRAHSMLVEPDWAIRHDCVCVDETRRSSHPEWCVRDAWTVRVTGVCIGHLPTSSSDFSMPSAPTVSRRPPSPVIARAAPVVRARVPVVPAAPAVVMHRPAMAMLGVGMGLGGPVLMHLGDGRVIVGDPMLMMALAAHANAGW